MIRLKIPLTDDVELLNEMKAWCMNHCERKKFYFFPQQLAIEEPVAIWFEREEDAFAFRFKYVAVEDITYGFEENY